MRKSVLMLWIGMVGGLLFHPVEGAVWTGKQPGARWNQKTNWSTGNVPQPGEKVQLYRTDAQPCILDSTVAEAIGALAIGDNNGPVSMQVKANGQLTIGGWAAVGYNRSATLSIEGGTVVSNTHFSVGMYDSRAGKMQLTIKDGSLSVASTFFQGHYFDGSHPVEVRTELTGGLLEAGGLSLRAGVMDISGGTLRVNGDITALVQDYERQGRMVAYGGQGGLCYDFGVSFPGKTTVTAQPPIAGDLDNDFDVDRKDLGLFAEHWLELNCGSEASFDQWCKVDLLDLGILGSNWKKGNVTDWHVIQTKVPGDDLIVSPHDARDFGIVANGQTDLTEAIQKALISVSQLGGGALYLPAGRYRVEGTLIIPSRVTLRGDWQVPSLAGPIEGTILEAYAGRGSEEGAPFIGLSSSSGVKGLAIWYPQQQGHDIQPYPPTLQRLTGGYQSVENVTLLNSYIGFTTYQPSITACPFARNVYGTPLKTGIEYDCLADIGRVEQVHFSPAYWKNSGLPGAPSGGEHEQWIYQNGTGMIVRRIDWSYSSYVTVDGYHIGLALRPSRYDGHTPNGQSYGFHLNNCQIGIYLQSNSYAGYQFSRFDIAGAEIGCYLGTSSSQAVMFHTCRIAGTDYSFLNEGSARILMMSCQVPQGMIQLEGGYLSVMNCDFGPADPYHIMLHGGVRGASILGNRFEGTPRIINQTLYPVIVNHDPVTVDPMPAYEYKQPARSYQPGTRRLFVVTEAPYYAQPDGQTDAASAIQAALNDAGAAGGGIVMVPGGSYRVEGHLVVPAKVELRGVFDIHHSTRDKGSVLNVYEGRENARGEPFIQLRAGAGLRGMTFHYPQQIYDDSDTVNFGMKPYPYLIQGQGEDVYIINIAATIPYQLLDLASYRCDRHYVDYILATALKTGIHVGRGSTGGQIQNCQFNPSAFTHQSGYYDSIPSGTSTGIHTILWRDATPYLFGDMRQEVLHENFVFGGRYGVRLVEENGKGPSGFCMGMGVDQCTNALQIDDIGDDGLDMINSQIVTVNCSAGRYLETGSQLKDTFRMFSSAGWGCNQYSAVINGGDIRLQLFHLARDGEAGSFKVLNGSSLQNLGGNLTDYLKAPRMYLTIDGTSTAEFIGNIIHADVSGMPSNSSQVTSFGNLRVP